MYSAMADLAWPDNFLAWGSHTQQWMPRLQRMYVMYCIVCIVYVNSVHKGPHKCKADQVVAGATNEIARDFFYPPPPRILPDQKHWTTKTTYHSNTTKNWINWEIDRQSKHCHRKASSQKHPKQKNIMIWPTCRSRPRECSGIRSHPWWRYNFNKITIDRYM